MSGEDTLGGGGSMARVMAELQRLGAEAEVVEMKASTRTATEAAAAIGCRVGQIAKSVVFRAPGSGRPVLVVASGANRVDVERLERALGEPVEVADPAWVRETTGFAVGGVAPVAHLTTPVVFLDEDLFQFEEIWAAAGTPRSVFGVAPEELARVTGARVIGVRA